MKAEIIIAGFGGQGVLSMGKLLAYAALIENREVSWIPEYGPEQRGGTVNATVIISEGRISSPIVSRYDIAVILNQTSLDKFEAKIKPGGILLYDDFGISRAPSRSDIIVRKISAMNVVAELGNAQVFNVVILGALIGMYPLVSVESISAALYKTLPERHHAQIPLNETAIRKGMSLVSETD